MRFLTLWNVGTFAILLTLNIVTVFFTFMSVRDIVMVNGAVIMGLIVLHADRKMKVDQERDTRRQDLARYRNGIEDRNRAYWKLKDEYDQLIGEVDE